MTEAEKDRIMLADAIRHIKREESNGLHSRASLASADMDQAYLKGIGMVSGRGKPRYSVRWKPSQASAYDRAERSGVEVLKGRKRTVVTQQHLSKRVSKI